MATCGYICPLCEGKGFLDNLKPCDYCETDKKVKIEISDEEWMETVHNGPCCGDRVSEVSNDSI